MTTADNARAFGYDRTRTRAYRAELAEAEVTEPACCYAQCSKLTVAKLVEPPVVPPGHHLERRCIPRPPGGTLAPSTSDPACPAGVQLDGTMAPYETSEDDTCCYQAVVETRYRGPIRGRAARVDGTPRFAAVGAGTAWRHAALVPETASLAPATRARLARAWLAAGRMEHASIAAFSNLALRLLAVGAPPDLVAATHAAALDEIAHARTCFELASTYGGASVGPAGFSAAVAMSASGGLAALAIETFIDGCVGETAAALEADRAADAATDPVIATALRTIAADEARHAQLAWAIVAWCVREAGPTLALELHAAFARLEAPEITDVGADLEPHGVLGRSALVDVRAEILREVIAPLLHTLAAA